MRLSGAIDNEVHIAVKRFLETGTSPDVDSLYQAIQRSNSSLKRKPKKIIFASIERVLEFLNVSESSDSEAEIEKAQPAPQPDNDIMNRALRANLASPRAPSPGETTEDTRKKRRMANGEPLPKRQKPERPSTEAPKDLSLEDVGGMDDVVLQMKELLVRPLMFPELFGALHVKMPNGILLHGPPGCGKTMLARSFASAMDLPFVELLGPSIVSGMSGESEKAIRDRFEEAKKMSPCVIFMDEIDAIAPKRESSQSQMEKRIVAQLLVSMDDLERDTSKPVMVLATTNRPDSLDPALRRGGRFGTEINIGVPNEQVRQHILRAQLRKTPLADDVDFKRLAKMTAGFVGADLHDLVSKAGSWQLARFFNALESQLKDEEMVIDDSPRPNNTNNTNETIQSVYRLIARGRRKELGMPEGFEHQKAVTMQAFLSVLPAITPSSKREGFATIPNVSWNDIGALKNVREALQAEIVRPIEEPELYAAFGATRPGGVLLWGPPGCGKTLLAKATAAESKANFISIKGPELLNKFVGESEAAVRRVFARARSSTPCVIFFDELDALVPRRDEAGSEASSRVVNTLLTELDGDERKGIYIIGATNRPDMIDEAMLRPGRLETPLFVDLPGPEERVEILTTLVRNKPVDGLAEVLNIVRACEGYSGADLGSLLAQAMSCAIGRRSVRMNAEDFSVATKKVKGSVNSMSKYYKLRERFG